MRLFDLIYQKAAILCGIVFENFFNNDYHTEKLSEFIIEDVAIVCSLLRLKTKTINMAGNSKWIEGEAVDFIKTEIRKSKRMFPYIDDNDKTPSWDVIFFCILIQVEKRVICLAKFLFK